MSEANQERFFFRVCVLDGNRIRIERILLLRARIEIARQDVSQARVDVKFARAACLLSFFAKQLHPASGVSASDAPSKTIISENLRTAPLQSRLGDG